MSLRNEPQHERSVAQPPAYPMARPAGCPFQLPQELVRLSKEEPSSRITIWNGTHPWLLTRYEDISTVQRDPRFSVDRQWPGFPHASSGAQLRSAGSRMFFGMDDPRHSHFRRMLIPEFSMPRVRALQPAVRAVVDGLLDDMDRRTPPVDLVDVFAARGPAMMLCALLGLPYDDHEFFSKNVRARLTLTTSEEDAKRGHSELVSYLTDLIRRRESEPSDDLIGRLVTNRVCTGEITRDEALALIEVLLAAGYSATGGTIALGTVVLLLHPEQASVMRDGGPQEVATAVEELIRYVNTTHLGRRRVAREDVRIGGVTIRAGEGVIAADAIANRDPEMFDNPDELDLRRSPNPHLVFGVGAHQCLGQQLARMQLAVAYPALLRRFPGLRLAVPLSELEFLPEATVYSVREVPVQW
ncbi:cytochrome P450 [Streptomyces sp. NPDC057654]|uniref:cytochrome P450 n=1 Tax=Streptomyces sp. NPDC057654 TaxID=3346196 RepID=UPI0036CD98A8